MYFELKNVSVHYDKVQALENVDLPVVRVDVRQPQQIGRAVRAHFVSAFRKPR